MNNKKEKNFIIKLIKSTEKQSQYTVKKQPNTSDVYGPIVFQQQKQQSN